MILIVLFFLCLPTLIKTSKFPCKSNQQYDFLNIDRFTDNMCAQCLWYMTGSHTPWINFTNTENWQIKYNYSNTINVLICNPNCTEFKYEHLKQPDNWIFKELRSNFYKDVLLNCCEDSRKCCQQMLSNKNPNSADNYCPEKWDGFMCWNSAEPGTISTQTCPSIAYFPIGFKPTVCRTEMANKECWPNGTWARITTLENGRISSDEYTDYQRCSTPGSLQNLRYIWVSIIVYVISLILTLIGLVILKLFPMKKLSNLYNIHCNFSLSLIATAIFSLLVLILIKYRHYNLNSMIGKNPLWCQILMLLMKFARMTNYCWMLNEGIILWQMVVQPFDKVKKKNFFIIGWILPIIIMLIYSACRIIFNYNTRCWTISMGYLELIYTAPTIIFILINFILILYMSYILYQKITSIDQDESQLREMVGKLFILMPVFGIHYLFYIVPFDPFESCSTVLFIIYYLLRIVEGLQGAIVTTIFCFLNKEIHSQIRQRLKNRKNRRKIIKNSRLPSRQTSMADQFELENLKLTK